MTSTMLYCVPGTKCVKRKTPVHHARRAFYRVLSDRSEDGILDILVEAVRDSYQCTLAAVFSPTST